MDARRHRKRGWLHHHSLSLVTIAILTAWLLLYSRSDPNTHLGSFFGNAIADWAGVLVTVIGTKYFYERGSAESRRPPGAVHRILVDHSLTIVLAVTGIGWAIAFAHSDVQGKWGQVIGNIVSEWTQLLGLVLLTKGLIEVKSKESRR